MKGFETFQDMLKMKRSLEDKNGLGFKPSLQNLRDQPSTSYADALKGNENQANIIATKKVQNNGDEIKST